MYTLKEPSPTAVFNSIIDNPSMGDTRNYVRCRIANDEKSKYVNEVAIRDDTTIAVYIWIDNASTADGQLINGARMQLSTGHEPVSDPALNVTLTGDNVIKVWDGCKVLSTSPTVLSYVPGSAQLHIYNTPPIKVDDAVVRGGKLLPGVRGNADGVIGGPSSSFYGFIELLVEAFVQ